MNAILGLHIAGGVVALLAGTAVVAARKGGSLHARMGTGFCVSMLVLGITAAILLPFKSPPESPIGGIMVCYFVATAWMTARRRSGVPGRFEKIAGAAILAIGALVIVGGVQAMIDPASRPGPPGPIGLFILGTICLLAGLGDFVFVRRGKLSHTQRISRHLWRMCFAFFIATGSFFLGQQDMLPQAMRGSALLLIPAFAPFAVMLFWLTKMWLSGMERRQERTLQPRA